MGRRSAEATKARLMWTSLREACAFFCADEAAACFDFVEGDFVEADFVEGDFLLDVCSEKPACNDTRAIQQESKKRLTCTDFNYRGKPAPMSETSLSARIRINSCVK